MEYALEQHWTVTPARPMPGVSGARGAAFRAECASPNVDDRAAVCFPAPAGARQGGLPPTCVDDSTRCSGIDAAAARDPSPCPAGSAPTDQDGRCFRARVAQHLRERSFDPASAATSPLPEAFPAFPRLADPQPEYRISRPQRARERLRRTLESGNGAQIWCACHARTLLWCMRSGQPGSRKIGVKDATYCFQKLFTREKPLAQSLPNEQRDEIIPLRDPYSDLLGDCSPRSLRGFFLGQNFGDEFRWILDVLLDCTQFHRLDDACTVLVGKIHRKAKLELGSGLSVPSISALPKHG